MPHIRPARAALAAVVIAAASLASPAAVGASTPVVPVPGLPDSTFTGHAAVAHPVRGVPTTPQNPHLAPNGDSGIHNDGWQTNTYRTAGPLGHNLTAVSGAVGGECGSITFDHAGRIVATCIGERTGLYLIDPATLATLGYYQLPGRDVQSIISHPNPFNDFSGGGYFYLDNKDRAVVATHDGHVLVLAENPTATGFVLKRDYDVSTVLQSGETLNSALPDNTGRIWFVAKTDGVVGTVAPSTGQIHVIRLGNGSDGEIENSFAVGMHRDVYIATNRRLYRFTSDGSGRPTIVWSASYRNSGQTKPGQVDDGTGTTPALLPGGYVAITDNANPMDVVVYTTAAGRHVCSVPVFAQDASDTENSLIAAGRSLVVENNYGYSDPTATSAGRTTTPGFARVDIDADGRGCHIAWTNHTVAAPSVVPKLSLATGLVYTYTKGTDATDRWSWTALSFRTGKLVWSRANGDGLAYNNNYAGLALGAHGVAYLGVLGGITELHDSP